MEAANSLNQDSMVQCRDHCWNVNDGASDNIAAWTGVELRLQVPLKKCS